MDSPSPSSSSGSSRRPLEDYSKDELVALVKDLRRRKRFGLVWEDKAEDVVEQCARELPVLEEVSEWTIEAAPGQPTNLIIEGDNYHALSVLNYTHAGKVDVIYIDPPYNTGHNDFIYNDRYVDGEDAYRHSKWLSFMRKRLLLAKRLLAEDGFILISIDDNELANLSLLASSIFGEENFRNTIVMSRVKKNIQERQYARSLNAGHGYVLFYAMPKALIKVPTKYQQKGDRWHAFDAPGIRTTMEYDLFGHRPPKGRHWMFEKAKAEAMIEKGLLRKNPRSGRPQYKLEASEETRLDTNWTDIQEGSAKWGFANGEKNIELVKRIIGMHPNAHSLVLDFFAGSGTTGHAVLQLNREDGGCRRFILCTNNENGIAEEVTYPRIKRVIEGVAELPELAGILANVRYFKTAFVPKHDVSDDTRLALVRRSTEMICVREGTFTKKYDNVRFKVYTDGSTATGILFDLDAIDEFKKKLGTLGLTAHLYVFSLSGDRFEDDFADLPVAHTLCPIPESILEVYRRLFTTV